MREMMKRFLVIVFIIFLINSSILIHGTGALDQKNFLWKVQSETGTAYILGSVHVLKKDFYPLNRSIEEAFEKSDVLVVEANINDISKIDVRKLMESAFYQENETLEKHVSRDTYELIRKEIKDKGLSLEFVNKQRPWFLALTLSTLELMRLGFNPNYGIDIHFLLKAEGKKRILELESIDYQIDIFSKLSDADQELFLLYTVRDLDTLKREIDTILRAWTSGDTKTMESILKSAAEDEKISLVYEKLVYERNRNMVSRIEEFLKTKNTHFIIVGAGHLVGDKGIIEILKEKRYLVKKL